MQELEPLSIVRVAALPDALDGAVATGCSVVLRIAPDEALFVDAESVTTDDQHAITLLDTGWSGVWVASDVAEAFLERNCAWSRPVERPTFAQGMVAHLPVKLWIENDRTLFVVARTFAEELGDRMADS